jgi:hypothetical protein
MFGKGPFVFAVWPYIIANKDENGILELNPEFIAAIIGCDPKEIEAAIEFLASPDPHSRSKKEDGRRIIQEGEFQWRVVNNEEYKEIARREHLRQYNREKKREERAKRCQGTVKVLSRDVKKGQDSSLSLPSISSSTPMDEKVEDLRVLWNTYAEAAGLPICGPFGNTANAKKRMASLWARLKEHPDLEEWAVIVSRVVGRPYCRGKNEKGWTATIDYLYRVSTFDDHFTGKFARVSPYILQEQAEASEAEAIDDYIGELSVTLAESAGKIDHSDTRQLVLIAAGAVEGFKGQDPDRISETMYALEGKLMESIADVWPGAAAIETECKAAEQETGVKWKALRDRRIRATLHLPRLDF